MTDNQISLSPSARAALEAAAAHPERLAEPPAMPAAARNAVLRSLENGGLIERLPGEPPAFRATEAGLAAVGVSAPAMVVQAPPEPAQPRQGVRAAAVALVAAWDAQSGLDEAVAALRGALAGKAARRAAGEPRTRRTDTKQAKVLALLGRGEGATLAQVIEITGWAQHTVRGFLAGLKKKGHQVDVLERVKQVGSGNQGARGSYSVYRVVGAAGQAEAG
ncbi:DUF3489 domain-containing protein [Plastoroseomonas hellenica]|uniref:DUF3489 domain-containing protein n=1 Tax=Plastoroseomonas hellenica TaxID=2687306 RepID=UPI001BAD3DE6|nr:DUF3489 domain-containing protein [Plastoroseomonas hellenica]